MIYSLEILTSPNTLISIPKKTDLKFPKGLIYKVDVDFPIGSQGLLYTRAMTADVQLYPFVRDQWFRGSNIIISFEDKSFFETESGIMTFETYNLDDYYDHYVTWRIGIITDSRIVSQMVMIFDNQKTTQIKSEIVVKSEGVATSSDERKKVFSDFFRKK